jgi:hypothetical protein
MAAAPRDEAQRRDVNINLRAPAQVKEMIDRTARLLGKSALPSRSLPLIILPHSTAETKI